MRKILLLLATAGALLAAPSITIHSIARTSAVVVPSGFDNSSLVLEVVNSKIGRQIYTITQSSGTATVTLVSPHYGNVKTGQWVYIRQGTGAVSAWDGWQQVASVPDGQTFTFSSATSGSFTNSGSAKVLLPVHDLDETLFTNSQHVASMASQSYVQIGRSTTEEGLDHRLYSRALQCDTEHFYYAHDGASHNAKGSFKTATIPLGDAAFVPPQFSTSAYAFGHQAIPTIDQADPEARVIDPDTGVAIAKISRAVLAEAVSTSKTLGYAFDLNGAWTNPTNAISTSIFASTSTTNAPLFLALNNLNLKAVWDADHGLWDLKLHTIGTGSGVLSVCITLDGGATCATDAQDITLSGSQTDYPVPASNWPNSFSAWNPHTPLNKGTMSNSPAPLVYISGHQVNMVGGGKVVFPPLSAGVKLSIPGSGCGSGTDLCTVSSFGGDKQVLISETLSERGGSTLASSVSPGATSISVNSAVSLYPTQHITFEPGTFSQETVQVSASYTAGSTTIPLVSGLSYSHSSGAVAVWAGNDDGCWDGSCPNAGDNAQIGTANSGSTSVTLTRIPYGLAPGMPVVFDPRVSGKREVAYVSSSWTPLSTTLTLTAPLTITHDTVPYGSEIEWSNAVTAQWYSAGFRVWLKSGSSASVRFNYDQATSLQWSAPNTNASFDHCNNLPISVTTDRAGHSWSEPKRGYLCNVASGSLYLVIPGDDFEFRLLSLYSVTGLSSQANISGNITVSIDPWVVGSATKFWGTNGGSGFTGHIIEGTYTPNGDFSEYDPGLSYPPATDKVVWTDLTASATPVDTQVSGMSSSNSAVALFNTGVLNKSFGYDAVLGGYGVYNVQNGQDQPCIKARTSGTSVIQVFDSFSSDPFRWGACHSGPAGTGSLMSLTLNRLINFNNTTPLGGPFQLNITKIKKNGTWTSWTKSITAYTSSSGTTTFTAPGIAIDPLLANRATTVTIAGGTGSFSVLNGTWPAYRAGDDDHFSIAYDALALGTFPGGMTVTATPPMITGQVKTVTTGTSGEPVISAVDYDQSTITHRLSDGDALYFTGASSPVYAKATGYDAQHFGLYTSTSLTTPASAPPVNSYYYYGEPCPSGLPTRVTQTAGNGQTGIYGDAGYPAGDPRCVVVKVTGQPFSLFATSTEHSLFPCADDPNNSSKSCPQAMQVGDLIGDYSNGPWDTSERFVVLKITQNSTTDIDLVLGRRSGGLWNNDPFPRGITNDLRHFPGWLALMAPTNKLAYFDATDSTATAKIMAPMYTQCHGDVGYGYPLGRLTYVSNCYDDIENVTADSFLSTIPVLTKIEHIPPFAASTGPTQAYPQSYAGHRQIIAPLYDHAWKGDWAAINPDFGGEPGTASGLWGGNTITAVSGHPTIYKISIATGTTLDIKRSPLIGWKGYTLLQHVGGPSVMLTDSDDDKMCAVYNAGECVSGSAKGEVYIASKYVTINSYCFSGGYSTVPCVASLPSTFGKALQMSITPLQTDGTRQRVLTSGLVAPGMHWTFETWAQDPEGKLGFFHAPYVNGLRSDNYVMQLPSWPGKDRFNRSTFVPLSVQVGAKSGATKARVKFGYGRFGSETSYYCSPDRQEACVTGTVTGSTSDPYAFASETATYTSCASGCTISVPALPGLVVNYTVEYLDNSNTVVYSTPLAKAVAAP